MGHVKYDPGLHRAFVVVQQLPNLCLTPHGVALDTEQHIAFIACVDETPPAMIRVDTQKLAVISEQPWPLEIKPDIITLDTQLHMVFVGCGVGLAVFQEEGRNLKSLGYYTYGINMHTVAVNEVTHEMYLPLTRVGNRPELRIMRYNPQPSR